MGQQNWISNAGKYSVIASSAKINRALPTKVYNLQQDEFTNEFYLLEMSDKFEFDFKLYEIETKFINHVLTTYVNTTSNLGVLLNGTKGTGKTVCAKLIANAMDLPVIIIRQHYKGLVDFLANIECDVILFFDEFEKTFGDRESSQLLSLMDGVYNSEYRKIFLLTSNSLYFDENLLSRPSRIRYKKEFNNLKIETILSYLKDNLQDKSQTQNVIDYVDTLEVSTIDILKCIVDELNIHHCSIEDIKEFMNIKTADYKYSIIECWDDKITTIDEFQEKYEFYAEELQGNAHSSFDDIDNWGENDIRTSRPIEQLMVGENIGSKTILETINKNGCMKVRYSDSYTCWVKVLNVENKPSLYNQYLTQAMVY